MKTSLSIRNASSFLSSFFSFNSDSSCLFLMFSDFFDRKFLNNNLDIVLRKKILKALNAIKFKIGFI